MVRDSVAGKVEKSLHRSEDVTVVNNYERWNPTGDPAHYADFLVAPRKPTRDIIALNEILSALSNQNNSDETRYFHVMGIKEGQRIYYGYLRYYEMIGLRKSTLEIQSHDADLDEETEDANFLPDQVEPLRRAATVRLIPHLSIAKQIDTHIQEQYGDDFYAALQLEPSLFEWTPAVLLKACIDADQGQLYPNRPNPDEYLRKLAKRKAGLAKVRAAAKKS